MHCQRREQALRKSKTQKGPAKAPRIHVFQSLEMYGYLCPSLKEAQLVMKDNTNKGDNSSLKNMWCKRDSIILSLRCWKISRTQKLSNSIGLLVWLLLVQSRPSQADGMQ